MVNIFNRSQIFVKKGVMKKKYILSMQNAKKSVSLCEQYLVYSQSLFCVILLSMWKKYCCFFKISKTIKINRTQNVLNNFQVFCQIEFQISFRYIPCIKSIYYCSFWKSHHHCIAIINATWMTHTLNAKMVIISVLKNIIILCSI